MSSHTSLTEWEVRNMLELGVEHGVVVDRWSDWRLVEEWRKRDVRFMTRGPDRLFSVSIPLPKFRRNGSRVTAT